MSHLIMLTFSLLRQIDKQTLFAIRSENRLMFQRSRRVGQGGIPEHQADTRQKGRNYSEKDYVKFPVIYQSLPRHQAKQLPTNFHNIAWLLRHMHEDLRNRSNFLNKMPKARWKFTILPKPFFARSLRASATTIGRLIH